MTSAERDIYIHLPWKVFELCHAVEKFSEKKFTCNFSYLLQHNDAGKPPAVTNCSVSVYRDVWDVVTLQASGIDKAVSPLSESCHFYLSDIVAEKRSECPDDTATSDGEDLMSAETSWAAQNDGGEVSDDAGDENDDDDFVNPELKPEENAAEITHSYNTRRRSRLLDTPVTPTNRKTRNKPTPRSLDTPKMQTNHKAPNTPASKITGSPGMKAARQHVTRGTNQHVTKATSQRVTEVASDCEESIEKCELCSKFLKNTESLYGHILWSHQNHPLSDTYKNKVRKHLYRQCEVCKREVFGVSGLVAHMQRVHSKKNIPVSCPLCKKEMKNRHTLVDHLRKTHKLNSHERRLRFGDISKMSSEESLQIRKEIKNQDSPDERLQKREISKWKAETMPEDEIEDDIVKEEDGTVSGNEMNEESPDERPKKRKISKGKAETMPEDEIVKEEDNTVSGNEIEDDTIKMEDGTISGNEVNDISIDHDNNCSYDTSMDHDYNTSKSPAENEQSVEVGEKSETKPPSRIRLNLTDQDMKKYMLQAPVRAGRRAEQNVCCTICKRWLKSSYSVYCHMTAEHRHHPDLEEHRKRMYAKSKTQCKECGKMFGNPNLYRSHHRRFHAKEAFQAVQCNLCAVICRNSECLKDHIYKHHIEHRHACRVCASTFLKPYQQRMHEHIRHGMHPELADKIYRFSCEYCDKRFYSHASHQKHMNSHKGIKPHLCDICGLSFSDRKGIRNHRSKAHPAEFQSEDGNVVAYRAEPLTCQMCGSKFSSQTKLNGHMRQAHNISPLFSCPECDLRFFSADELKLHLEERHALLCSLCDASLLGESDLTEHLMVVHNVHTVKSEEPVFEDLEIGDEEEQNAQVYIPHDQMLSDNMVVLCTVEDADTSAVIETVATDTEKVTVHSEDAAMMTDDATVTETGVVEGKV